MRFPVPAGVSPFDFTATAEAAIDAAQEGEHLFAYDHKTRSFVSDAPGRSHMDTNLVEFFTVNSQWKDNEIVKAAQAHANKKGAFIVGINGRRVTLAPMLPAIAKIRAKITELLASVKTIQPWEVEILEATWSADEPRLDRLRVRTRTLVLDPATARDRWKWVAPQVPELFGNWRTSFDVTTGIATFQYGDPLARTVEYRWDEPVTHTSIPFGAAEDGTTVCMGLYERNILLGGTPGSGKSGGATALLAGISRLEHVALVGLDPKRVELSVWEDRFSMVAKRDDERADAEGIDRFHHATAVLNALKGEMHRRYRWVESESKKDGPTKGLKKVPLSRLAEMPLIVLFIDELADLVHGAITKADIDGEKERKESIRTLIAMGRAAGIIVITATQKPSSDIVPTATRDLIQQRVAFSTSTPDMTDVILAKGSSSNGALSHEIPAGQQGMAYLLNEESRVPKRVRAFWVPDEDVPGLVAQTAHLRVPLPFLPTANGSPSVSPASSVRPGGPGAVPSWDDSSPAPAPSWDDGLFVP